MQEFMKWLNAEKIEEQENGVYIKLKNHKNIEEYSQLLIESYDCRKISEMEFIMSKEEFEALKQVYQSSLTSWR